MKILAISILTTTLIFTSLASAETVTIANGNDYKPFADVSLKRGGIASHIVEEAFKASGWTVKYDWLPWKRGFEMTKSAKIDGAIPWAKRKDRMEFFEYSESMMTIVAQVWTLKDSGIRSNNDLKGKVGCVPIGYSDAPDQKAMIESGEIKRDSPKDMTTCFKKLEAKRVDFVMVNGLQANSIVNAVIKDKESMHAAITSDNSDDLYLIVGKNHPKKSEILKAFNSGLAALKSSGEIEKIVASH